MIENKKTYNGHTYSGVQLDACINGYQQGRADALEELYNDVLYIENKFNSMLLNTKQEDILEQLDLNGKLMAIKTIKKYISDKVKEQKNEFN